MKTVCRFGILSLFVGMGLITGCNDDDDEFRLSEEQLARKDWYYNGTRDQWGYSSNDVMEVLNFNVNHVIVEKEFAGRQETRRGSWSLADANNLTIDWSESERENWVVLDCDDSRLEVLGWGERVYVTDDGLQDLTGDAYWINEFSGGGSEGFTTRLGFALSGNPNVRDAYVLLSDNEEGRVKLDRAASATLWTGRVERPNEDTRVRFSCRIGAGDYMKFDDEVSRNNFANMPLSDIGLRFSKESGREGVNISWNKLQDAEVYYQIVVYEDGQETDPHFVSNLLGGENGDINITPTTSGVVNEIDEIGVETLCRARLMIMMLEPGVDKNDTYATDNLQAVIYATTGTFTL